MKLIVAGSRGFIGGTRWARAFKMLDDILAKYPDMEVIAGGAAGADFMGEWWARNRRRKLTVLRADWNKHGRAAGAIRNSSMAAVGTHLLAFWDGVSSGTRDMIEKARAKNLTVHVVRFDQW